MEERGIHIIGKGKTIIRNSSDVKDVIFGRYAYVLFINIISRDLVRIEEITPQLYKPINCIAL